MKMSGKQLLIQGKPQAVGFVQVNEPFTAKQADIQIESSNHAMKIKLTGDFSAYRFAHFFTVNTYSPERFYRVKMTPKHIAKWQMQYQFTCQ